MKGRFRLLRYGVRLYGIEKTDQVWMTCCALHNMLLQFDGLVKGWENGVKSVWEEEVDQKADLPFALQRLMKPGTSRNYDLSGTGFGDDYRTCRLHVHRDTLISDNATPVTNEMLDNITMKSVRQMSLQKFRDKLTTHFNIAFEKKEIEWPRRSSKKQRTN